MNTDFKMLYSFAGRGIVEEQCNTDSCLRETWIVTGGALMLHNLFIPIDWVHALLVIVVQSFHNKIHLHYRHAPSWC